MFELRLRQRNITEKELLGDICKVAQRLHQKTITSLEYDEYGYFGKTTILRRFGSWNNALNLAGLEVKNRQNISNKELFENIAEIWKRLGKQPTGKDLEKAYGISKISSGTYEKRFGSWNKALLAFIQYIENNYQDNENPPVTDLKKQYIRTTPRKINWRIRAKVLIRDNCICKMCGSSPAKDPEVNLHVDHIIPWSKCGETIIDNLQTLCNVCNIGKSDLIL